MHVMSVGVRSYSDLEVGCWYRITGEDASGHPLPEQVFYLQEKRLHATFLGLGEIVGTLWTRMWGRLWVFPSYRMQPGELNVGGEHGFHGIHMERIDRARAHALMEVPDGYHEMVQERRGGVKVLGSDYWDEVVRRG